MDDKLYNSLKLERAIERQGRRSWNRGYAAKHKTNWICLECRRPYNHVLPHCIVPDGYNVAIGFTRFCPLHKTELRIYVGHVPRKANINKWGKLKKSFDRLAK